MSLLRGTIDLHALYQFVMAQRVALKNTPSKGGCGKPVENRVLPIWVRCLLYTRKPPIFNT